MPDRSALGSGLHRIPLDITPHSSELLIIANQMIVAFILPERRPMPYEHSDSFVASKSFERSRRFPRRYPWRSQQANVIGHDDERVEIIAPETVFAFGQCPDDHFRDLRLSQRNRGALRMIRQSVHGDKCLSMSEPAWRDNTAGRETSVQTECDQDPFSGNVPMREAPTVVAHTECSRDGQTIVSWKARRTLGRAEARRQARRPAPQAKL